MSSPTSSRRRRPARKAFLRGPAFLSATRPPECGGPGDSAEGLGLTGRERFTIDLPAELKPRQEVPIRIEREDGPAQTVLTQSRLDTPIDVRYYQNGGILQTVLRDLIRRK